MRMEKGWERYWKGLASWPPNSRRNWPALAESWPSEPKGMRQGRKEEREAARRREERIRRTREMGRRAGMEEGLGVEGFKIRGPR
jgi:hypothetical protein